jgi:hypothetical protein
MTCMFSFIYFISSPIIFIHISCCRLRYWWTDTSHLILAIEIIWFDQWFDVMQSQDRALGALLCFFHLRLPILSFFGSKSVGGLGDFTTFLAVGGSSPPALAPDPPMVWWLVAQFGSTSWRSAGQNIDSSNVATLFTKSFFLSPLHFYRKSLWYAPLVLVLLWSRD